MSNTVRVHIEGSEDVSSAVDKAIAKLKELDNKNFDIDLDIDTSKAERKIKELEARIDAIRDKKVHIDVETRDARDKIRYLHNRLDELGNKKPQIDLDTTKARDKIRYLIDRMKEVGKTKVDIDVDNSKALASVAAVQAALDTLTDKHVNIKIDVDEAALAKSLAKAMRNLNSSENRVQIKIDIDEAYLQRSLAKAIRGLNSQEDKLKLKIDVDENYLARAIKKALRNLNNDDTIRLKIKVEADADALLKSIRLIMKAINKSDDRIKLKVDVDDDYLVRSLARALRGISSSEAADRLKVRASVDEDHLRRSMDRAMGPKDQREKRKIKVDTDVDDDQKGVLGILSDMLRGGDQTVRKRIKVETDKDIMDRLNDGLDKLNGERDAELKVQTYSALASLQAVEDKLDSLNDEVVNVRINTYGDEADRTLRNAIRGIEDDLSIDIDTDVDFTELESKLAAIRSAVESADGLKATTDFDVDTGAAMAKIAAIEAAMKSLGDARLGLDIDAGAAIAKVEAIKAMIETLDNETIDLQVEADTAAATAAILAASQDRRATIHVDVDMDNSAISRAMARLSNTDFGRAIGRNFGDADRNGRSFLSTVGSLTRASTGLLNGLAGVTGRIPVLGAAFGGIASGAVRLGSSLTALGGKFGTVGGAIGGIAAAAIAGGAAMAAMGTIGVLGTGALVAGLYATNAALGVVAGGASLIASAFGGAIAGSFIYFAAQNEEVQKSLDQTVQHVGTRMKEISSVVGPSLIRIADTAKNVFDKQLTPSLERMADKTGTLVDQLGGKLGPVAAQLGPMLEKAFDSGATHLNLLADALPDIISGMGDFFQSLNSPEVVQAAKTALGAIPEMITGIGSAVEGAAGMFNDLNQYLGSEQLQPLRDGWNQIKQSFADTDWSGMQDGITAAANAFGGFMGQFDMGNVAGTIEGVAGAFENLTNIASAINLDGIFNGVAQGAEMATAAVSMITDTLTAPIKLAFDISGDILGGIKDLIGFGGADVEVPVKVLPNVDQQGAQNFLEDLYKGVPEQNVDVPINIKPAPRIVGSADSMDKWIGAYVDAAKGNPISAEIPINAQLKLAQALEVPELGNLKSMLRAKLAVNDGVIEIPISVATKLEALAPGMSVEDIIKGIIGDPNAEVSVRITPEVDGAVDLKTMFDGLNATIKVSPEEMDLGRLQSQLESLEGFLKVHPELQDVEGMRAAIEGLEAKIKATPELGDISGILKALEGLKAIIKTEVEPPVFPKEFIPPPVEFPSRVATPASFPMVTPPTITFPSNISPPGMPIMPVPPTIRIPSVIEPPNVQGFSGGLNLPPLKQKVEIQRDKDLFFGGGALPPLTQEIIAMRGPGFNKERAEKLAPIIQEIQLGPMPAIPPVRVLIVPDFAGFLAVMGGLMNLPPVRVPIIPDTAAFGAALGALSAGVAMAPIRVPVIPDMSTFSMGMAGVMMTPIRVPVIPDFSAAMIAMPVMAPVHVPVVFDIPPLQIPTPSVHVTVTSNAAEVAAQVNSIPTSVNTQHTVDTNAETVIGRVQALNGLHTSSTHTVVVSVTGPGAALLGGAASPARLAGGENLKFGGADLGLGGFAPLGGMPGTAGIMGAPTGGGLEGVAGLVSSGRGATLAISNSEMNNIITNWSSLGSTIGQAFSDGLHNSFDMVQNSLLTLNDIINSGLVVIGAGIFDQDGIGRATQLASKELANGMKYYAPTALARSSPTWGFNLTNFLDGLFGDGNWFSGILSGIFAGAHGLRPPRAVNSGSLNAAGQMIVYNHYETTTNQFDGGLVGNPEAQAKKVLDVLEQGASQRRLATVLAIGNTNG